MNTTYDSRNDTKAHIHRVEQLLLAVKNNILFRSEVHDRSKLEEPEKSIFDTYTPKLKDCTYGSDEYKGYLAEMKVALDHHYMVCSHHPEHYSKGIDGMSLIDLIEMLCDWKAAGERHADGNMAASLTKNKERFHINDQLQSILENTVKEMGWVT